MSSMKLLNYTLVVAITFNYLPYGQTQSTSIQAPQSSATNTLNIDNLEGPTPTYSVAQLVPAYKIALKKGMFEISSGYGHIDETQQSYRGQSQNIKQNPQLDFFPFQLAYALTDNFNIGILGKALRSTERVSNTSLEGYSEPQLTATYAIRNSNSALLLTGIYSADVGPKELTAKGSSRNEGNTLKGGASAELQGGYFSRLGPMILGGEISYLYKDTRIENTKSILLFTSNDTAPTQTRIEGGAEKSVRAIAEIAMSFRLGLFAGRTWIEPEDKIITNQLAGITSSSYYKNFYGVYGRVQINPRLSLIPLLSVSDAPDTSGLSSQSTHEVLTQANIRYRF